MTQKEYVSYDAMELAAAVHRGDVTATELLELALQRLEALNPQINAVVHLMEEDARSAATTPTNGPFYGVPFLAKDLSSMYAGHPTSAGSRFMRNHMVTWDSELARRVKRSGVTVFGKTNTPEWGLQPVTEPELWGPTLNPWDVGRSSGGSSGGAGAAIAAGIVPMAGGGDGGGSIRIPASCCGLFGLKPSRGRTPTGPNRGQFWRGASIEHVITRSVRDSAAMLDATHGPDPGVPFEIPPPSGPWLKEVGFEPPSLRIAYTTTPSVAVDVHQDCIDAVEDAAQLLASLGHDVVSDHVPIDGVQFARDFLTIVAGELGADLDEASRAVGRRPRRQELEPATWALGLISDVLSAHDYASALRRMEVMARDVGVFFEHYDVILTPTVSLPPPPIGTVGPSTSEKAQLKLLGMFGSGHLMKAAGLIDQAAKSALDFIPWTPVFNITGHPAMSVPLYWNTDNLPIGVHFVGRFAREDTLFRLAGQLERARPWFNRLSPMALRF